MLPVKGPAPSLREVTLDDKYSVEKPCRSIANLREGGGADQIAQWIAIGRAVPLFAVTKAGQPSDMLRMSRARVAAVATRQQLRSGRSDLRRDLVARHRDPRLMVRLARLDDHGRSEAVGNEAIERVLINIINEDVPSAQNSVHGCLPAMMAIAEVRRLRIRFTMHSFHARFRCGAACAAA
jgi:hypothetical protein